MISNKLKTLATLAAVIGVSVIAGTSLRAIVDYERGYSFNQETRIAAPRYVNVEKSKGANAFLRDFPTQIPGAGRIDKYLTPDARYCLVHVRQKHLVENIPEENKKRVSTVQNDIYNILSYLIDNRRLNEVYKEGIPIGWEDIANFQKESNSAQDALNSLMGEFSFEQTSRGSISHLEMEISAIENKKYLIFTEDRAGKLKELKKELEEKKSGLPLAIEKDNQYKKEREAQLQERMEREKYDAIDKLLAEGKLSVISSEEAYSNVLADKTMDDSKKEDKIDSKRLKIILDNREEVLLEIIAGKEQKDYALTVYGGGHAWGGNESFGESYNLDGRKNLEDNIAIWNKQHPDKKFSLIEITPEGYN